MRENRLLQKIEPYRAARSEQRMQGTVPLKALKRASEIFAEATGELTVSFDFYMEAETLPVVRVGCSGLLPLKCQRCLGIFQQSLSLTFTLGMIKHTAEVKQLTSEYDPFILTSEFITPAEIIEDEIILNIPVVPKHEPNHPSCINLPTEDDIISDKAGDNPFDILKKLHIGDA